MIIENYINGIQVLESGSGKPIVLLHSAGQPPIGYKKQINYIAEYGQVFAPNIYDLANIKDCSLDKISQRLHFVIKTLGIEGITFVGCSLGGGVALRYASLYPDEVSQVIACDSIGYPINRSLWSWIKAYKRMADASNSLPERVRHVDPGSRNAMRELLKNPKGFYNANKLAMSCDIRDRLHTVSCPVHLYWSEKDEFIPVENGLKLQTLLPNATFELVPNPSHYWYNMEPLRFARNVKKHL